MIGKNQMVPLLWLENCSTTSRETKEKSCIKQQRKCKNTTTNVCSILEGINEIYNHIPINVDLRTIYAWHAIIYILYREIT